MLNLLKNNYSFILIFLLLIFYGINNYIWLSDHQLPSCFDEAYHLVSSLKYVDILRHPSKDMFSSLLKVDDRRPPFFHFCMAVSNIIWGKSKASSVIMTNIFFAGILFLSVYHIGKNMEDKKTGLLAVFIVAMYPYIFGLSRMSLPNFASIAVICLSLWCIICTDSFTRLFPSILLGLFIGLGSLTRLTFIFFVIGPLIIIAIIALFDKNLAFERKKIILNLALIIIVAVAIGGIWYFPRLPFLIKTYFKVGYHLTPPIFPPLFSFPSYIYYFRSLINGQISLFFAFIFLIALVRILKSRRERLKPLLFSWIIIAYIIFTLIKTKDFKNTSAYLPAFALITSIGIMKFRTQWLKKILVYVIILGGLFQYFIISFTEPSLTNIRLSFFNGKIVEGLIIPSYLYPLSEVNFHYPRKGDWRLDDVIAVIKQNSFDKKNITIGVTDAYIDIKTDWFDPLRIDSSHENFITTNVDALEYFLRTNRLFYNVISLSYWNEDWRRKPLLDFIISVKEIENLAPLISQQYKLIFQTAVPDRSPIYVYKAI